MWIFDRSRVGLGFAVLNCRDNAGRQLRRQRSTVYRKRPSKRKTRPYLLETERASQLSNTSGSVFNVQSKRGPWDSDHVWTKENKDELAKEVPGLDDALVAAKYDVFVKEGQLDGALEVVSLATSANRKKVLNRYGAKSFLLLFSLEEAKAFCCKGRFAQLN